MLINSRPRKCLNYVSSFEKFLHKISFKKKFGKMSQYNIAIYVLKQHFLDNYKYPFSLYQFITSFKVSSNDLNSHPNSFLLFL